MVECVAALESPTQGKQHASIWQKRLLINRKINRPVKIGSCGSFTCSCIDFRVNFAARLNHACPTAIYIRYRDAFIFASCLKFSFDHHCVIGCSMAVPRLLMPLGKPNHSGSGPGFRITPQHRHFNRVSIFQWCTWYILISGDGLFRRYTSPSVKRHQRMIDGTNSIFYPVRPGRLCQDLQATLQF